MAPVPPPELPTLSPRYNRAGGEGSARAGFFCCGRELRETDFGLSTAMELRVVNEKIGGPTAADHLTDAIFWCCRSTQEIFHVQPVVPIFGDNSETQVLRPNPCHPKI
jgi:hypothetical protein